MKFLLSWRPILEVLHHQSVSFLFLLNTYSLHFVLQKVDVLCGIGIKKVACGTQFSVALTKDGHVYTFGQGKAFFILHHELVL